MGQKWLNCKIYKQLMQKKKKQTNKKQTNKNNPIRQWTEDLNKHLSKEDM